MQSVLANFTMPTVLSSLIPVAKSVLSTAANTKTNATSSTGTSSSTSSSTSANSLGSTFLQPAGTGVAESGSHGSGRSHCDGWPDDLFEPVGTAHRHQSGHLRLLNHGNNDDCDTGSGKHSRQCCARLSYRWRHQHALTFSRRCGHQPTSI